MANVALWRLYLGSITGPVGTGFELLGMLGLWYCCRRAAPHQSLCASLRICQSTWQHRGSGPFQSVAAPHARPLVKGIVIQLERPVLSALNRQKDAKK